MIKRTLMQRDQELIDFEIEPASGKVRIIDMSEAGASLIASMKLNQQNDDSVLFNLVYDRTISGLRLDRNKIIAAFNAKSAIDLVLMGHGLSLFDQYWYRKQGATERWQDINFFDNEWDLSFGEAVLTGNYTKLASCSPDVPDVTTRGHAIKTWEYSAEGIIFIKVSNRYEGAELTGIKLAVDLCARIFDKNCYVPVKAAQRYGLPCSISPLMLTSNEELIDGNCLNALAGIQEANDQGGTINSKLCESRMKAYETIGIKDATAHVTRMACFSCLSLLADFHAGNFGAIHNIDSDAWRAAPLYDYDGAFGFPFKNNELEVFCKNPFLAELFCVKQFSYLHPSWNWSWYNPQSLEGFEDRIREAYAPYSNLPTNFIDLVVRLFVMQRDYVNSIAAEQT